MNPPLPKGYSTSHILTYRKCKYKFLLAYIYKAKVETKFKPLIVGSDIHESISKGIFSSEDLDKQHMLNTAKDVIDKMPCNPVFETTIEDKSNPGKFTGKIFDLPFMGIFDVHWPYERIGVDWKTGIFHEEYKNDYEIQAFVLNELFKQRYKRNLSKFVFVFLKDGYQYNAECISNDKARRRKEIMIQNALDGIKRMEFKKTTSYACQWCDYQGMCI